MKQQSALRVGIVPYLNMLPLVAGLEDLRGPRGEELRVVSTPPAEMTRLMEAGELDLGMVPVGGLFDHPEWRVVGRSMIGARGAVKSVLALALDPPERWTRLRPDSHSRTSNALARTILAGRYGRTVELAPPIPPAGWTPPARPEPGEAYLLIGTRALRWRDLWKAEGGCALDLGAAWTEWTGLPFAFAVWAARSGADLGDWMERFEELKARNRARLPQLIAARGAGLAEEGLTEAEAAEYLTRHIQFDLGEPELAAIERFYEEGRKVGVFREGWRLRAE